MDVTLLLLLCKLHVKKSQMNKKQLAFLPESVNYSAAVESVFFLNRLE